ncbi:MAG: M23 family metallopeptidase, partial [bacterium]
MDFLRPYKNIGLKAVVKVSPFTSACTLLLSVALTFPTGAHALKLRVMWNPSKVKPGSAVVLKVEAPVELRKAEAVAGGERFPLIKTGTWSYSVLIGIDMKYKYAIYPVKIELFPMKGTAPYRIKADLKVPGREYASQSLLLPQGMVELSEDRLSRVRNETGTVREALRRRSGVRYWKGPFLMPLTGRQTGGYGVRRILNGKERSPHKGVDMASPEGTAIKASNGAVVSLTKELLLSGNTVVLDHGWGVSTIYAHMRSIAVKEGQIVRRGQIIGEVGSTGRA